MRRARIVRSKATTFGIKPPTFDQRDIHVHVPEGATPKDGPSAGAAMATSIISVFTGIPVRRDVAMTGEVTLRGRVLPIGGLKEKLLAALRAGIKTVIIPAENEKDLADIPDNVKNRPEDRAGVERSTKSSRSRSCVSRPRSTGRTPKSCRQLRCRRMTETPSSPTNTLPGPGSNPIRALFLQKSRDSAGFGLGAWAAKP